MVFGDDAHPRQGPLVLVRPAALAATPGASVNPDFDRAADRRAVAAAVGKHRFAAHQGVTSPPAAGDAVAREHLAHHAFHALG